MARLDAAARLKLRSLVTAILGSLEKRVFDDPQMRNIRRLPFFFRVHAANALAGIRITYHPHTVPNQPPNIDRVADDPMPALRVAQDAGCAPEPSARRRDMFSVQNCRDFARRASIRIKLENAPDGFRFFFHDFQFAWLPWDRTIAIGPAAGIAAFADNAGHAAPNMQGKVFDEMFGHHRPNASIQAPYYAAGRMNLDSQEIQPLARPMPIGLIARDAIYIFGNDGFEQAGARRLHHRLETGTMRR